MVKSSPNVSPRSPRVRSAVLLETELAEASRELAEAETKRDHVAIGNLREVIHRLRNELTAENLDPHHQVHRRAAHHQKAKA